MYRLAADFSINGGRCPVIGKESCIDKENSRNRLKRVQAGLALRFAEVPGKPTVFV